MKPVRSRRQPWRVRILMSAVGATLGASSMGFGQTAASWIGGSSGSWTESAKWSTTPFYPTQDNPSGTTYDAVVNSPSHAFIVLNSAVTLNSLTMDSPTLLRLGGGARLQAATITLNSGSIETLGGAEIYNSTLRTSGADRRFYLGAVLNASTIGNSMAIGDVLVRNGLNLQNASLSAQLSFDGSQTLGGIGTVALSDYTPLLIKSGTTIFDSGITLLSNTDVGNIGGNDYSASPGAWINRGTIATSKVMQLNANWRNEGTFQLNGGYLVLGGNFKSSGIGTVNWTAGDLVLSGHIDNTGSTLDFDLLGAPVDVRPHLFGDTPAITGGTLHFSATSPVSIDSATHLDGVTISGEWIVREQPRVRQLSIAAGSKLRIKGGLLAGFGEPVGSAPDTILGAGEIVLEGGSLGSRNIDLTISDDVSTTGTGTIAALSLNNLGRISASQGSLVISGTLYNNGLLKPSGGGSVVLDSSTMPGQLGKFDSTDGAVAIKNWRLDPNQILLLNGVENTLTLAGTLSNGAIEATNGGKLLIASKVSNIINTQLGLDVSVGDGATINLTGNTSITPGKKIHLMGEQSQVRIGAAVSGEIVLDGGSGTGILIGDTTNQTFGSQLIIRNLGGNATIGGSGTYTTQSKALISSEAANFTIRVTGTGHTFNNLGTFQLSNGAISITSPFINSNLVNVTGGAFSCGTATNLGTIAVMSGFATIPGNLNNQGTIILGDGEILLRDTIDFTKFKGLARSGGTVSLSGTFNNTNTTADLTAVVGPWQARTGAVIVGGTIVPPAPGQSLRVLAGTFTVDGADLATDVALERNARIYFRNAWSSHGLITSTDIATVSFGGNYPTAAIGSLSLINGRVDFTGTADNTGVTLPAEFGPSSIVTLRAGTISGGTIGSAGQVFNVNSGTLSNVALTANTVVSGTLSITNGLTLIAGARLQLSGSGSVSFPGTQALTGNGEVVFDGSTTLRGIGPGSAAAVLTLGNGVTVRTGSTGGTVGADLAWVINQGTISSQTPARDIRINGTFTNQGVAEVRNGGSLQLSTATQVTNYTSGTLTGGTWRVGAGSTMTFGSATITTNNATIVLDGVGSSFAPINQLRSNLGRFTITNGRDFNSVGSLTNSGTIVVGPGSTLNVLDSFNNLSGLLDLNFKMVVDYTAASPLDELVGQIGSQIISSAVNADPGLAIGSIDDGNVVRLQIVANGDANLDGVVNYNDLSTLASNYTSSDLVAGSLVAVPTSLNDPKWVDGDFNYDGAVNLTDLYALGWQYKDPEHPLAESLTALNLPAINVPEPTVVLAAAAGTLLLRRRRVTIA